MSKVTTRSLVVSEMFVSIQGEGNTVGHRAIFLRLTGCNLTCKGWSFKNSEGNVVGCDTYEVWKKGVSYTIDKLLEEFETRGFVRYLSLGSHLVISGGEPLLQQTAIHSFLMIFWATFQFLPVIEIETNCTILPSTPLVGAVTQFNCSPKLSTNGDPTEKTYVPETINFFANLTHHRHNPTVIFKFVVTSKEDIAEVENKFVHKFRIPRSCVRLMPEGATRKEIEEHSQWLVPLCLFHGFDFSPRLHIHIWDKATGV